MKLLTVLVLTLLLRAALAMGFLYAFARFVFWMWPEGTWVNIAFCSVLAINYFLIVCGICPRGFRDWPRLWR